MREDSDVNLFFDHPEGSLGLRVAMEVKVGSPPRTVRNKNRHRDAAELAAGSARPDTSLGAARIL